MSEPEKVEGMVFADMALISRIEELTQVIVDEPDKALQTAAKLRWVMESAIAIRWAAWAESTKATEKSLGAPIITADFLQGSMLAVAKLTATWAEQGRGFDPFEGRDAPKGT